MNTHSITALTPVWLVCQPQQRPTPEQLARFGYRAVAAEQATSILFYGLDKASVLDVLPNPICCPTCGCNNVHVFQVRMVESGSVEYMDSLLTKDGFYVSPRSGKSYRDQSTEDEIAHCQFCFASGPLSFFGFDLAQDNAPTVVISADEELLVRLDNLADLGAHFTLQPSTRVLSNEVLIRVFTPDRPLLPVQNSGTPVADPSLEPPNDTPYWIVEIPEVHYSRRRISRQEAATADEALAAAMDAGGETLDGLEYSDTLQPDERNWKVRAPLSDEL